MRSKLVSEVQENVSKLQVSTSLRSRNRDQDVIHRLIADRPEFPRNLYLDRNHSIRFDNLAGILWKYSRQSCVLRT